MTMDMGKEAVEVRRLYFQMEEIAEGGTGEIAVFEQNQSPVHTTLKDHAHIWEKEGASSFQLNIVKEGLRLKLCGAPSAYHEKNNQSFNE